MKGNKQLEMTRDEYRQKISRFEKVILDLGTGDGRFVYKMAQDYPENFYVGLDTNVKQLEKYSKMTVRKNLDNTLFVIGSLEILPEELKNTVSKIFIILPWGSLLKNVVLPSREHFATLNSLFKGSGELKVILGYSQELEPSEAERLELPQISHSFIKNELLPKYRSAGFEDTYLKTLKKTDLKEIETTWSKKLAHGKMRKIFQLIFAYR